MDQGKLPTFATIKQKGSYGLLRSTTPHYSAPAWVSIVTGVGPGKHGIYDFFHTDCVEKKLVNSRYRKYPAVWNYLTDIGKRSIIVNVPGTYPPEPINGVMITGLLTPSPDSSFTHPPEIKADLTNDKLGTYELEQVGVDDIPKNLTARYAPEKLADQINRITTSHATVCMNLMKTRPWDFAMVVFRGTDDAMHLLWNRQDLILSCYQTADYHLGQLMKQFPDAFFLIVSDHGFEKPQKYLYVNNVLYNAGYIKTHTDPNYTATSLFLYLFNKISKLIFHLIPLEKVLRTSLGRKLVLGGGTGSNIDLSHTIALYHSVCSRGIRINCKDKYDHGIVERKDYDKIRNALITLFKDIIDPDTGKPVIKEVIKSEDIYGKDAVNDPLDIVLELERGYGAQELLRTPDALPRSSFSRHDKLPILAQPGF